MNTGNTSITFVLALPVALIVVVIVVALFALPLLQHRNLERTHAAIIQAQHGCLPGTVERVERWGPAGYSRYCVKDALKHGRFMAWEGARKVIEGNFLEGHEHGTWVYFDDAGKATRTIEYSAGKVVKKPETERRSLSKSVQ